MCWHGRTRPRHTTLGRRDEHGRGARLCRHSGPRPTALDGSVADMREKSPATGGRCSRYSRSIREKQRIQDARRFQEYERGRARAAKIRLTGNGRVHPRLMVSPRSAGRFHQVGRHAWRGQLRKACRRREFWRCQSGVRFQSRIRRYRRERFECAWLAQRSYQECSRNGTKCTPQGIGLPSSSVTSEPWLSMIRGTPLAARPIGPIQMTTCVTGPFRDRERTAGRRSAASRRDERTLLANQCGRCARSDPPRWRDRSCAGRCMPELILMPKPWL